MYIKPWIAYINYHKVHFHRHHLLHELTIYDIFLIFIRSLCSPFPKIFSALTNKYPFIVIFCVDLSGEIIPLYLILDYTLPPPSWGGRIYYIFAYCTALISSSYLCSCHDLSFSSSSFVIHSCIKNFPTFVTQSSFKINRVKMKGYDSYLISATHI